MNARDPSRQAEEAWQWIARADQDVAMVHRLLTEPPLPDRATIEAVLDQIAALRAAVVGLTG